MPAESEIPHIDVHELAARSAAGAVVVDVREPAEHAAAHVPGVILIPLGELVERTDEVPADRTIYVICASGGRSARAAKHLRSLGIDAVNVAGGTIGWIEAGLPVEPAQGTAPGSA